MKPSVPTNVSASLPPQEGRSSTFPGTMDFSFPPGKWWFVFLALLVLHLTHPLCLNLPQPGLWYPTLGLGLALIAWLGPGAVLLVLVDGILILLQVQLLYSEPALSLPLPLALGDLFFTFVGLPLVWWIYRHMGGVRDLNEPRSAILFLLLLPGAFAGLVALERTGALFLTDAFDSSGELAIPLGSLLLASWLELALGLLLVAPPLLVCMTPVLRRLDLIPSRAPGISGLVDPARQTPGGFGGSMPIHGPVPEESGRGISPDYTNEGASFTSREVPRSPQPSHPSRSRHSAELGLPDGFHQHGSDTTLVPRSGDWLEILGLTVGAGILGLVLLSRILSVDLESSPTSAGSLLPGWQLLWAVPLLLIAWASLRQCLQGGLLVALALALPLVTCLPLTFPLRIGLSESARALPWIHLQASLLALGCTALLVGGSVAWLRWRELHYQQVLARIPVVIYTACLLEDNSRAETPQANRDTPADQLVASLRKTPTGQQTEKPHTSTRTSVPKVRSPLSRPLRTQDIHISLVSAACHELLECPPEQVLGDYARWLARIHPDDREVALAAVNQLRLQSQPVTCEYRLAPASEGTGASTRDPQVRWLRDTLAPRHDRQGKLVGWDGVITDITEQRALAIDLRCSTSMFNALLTNLPAGVFFVQGPHGQPLLVNARARELLGQREVLAAQLDHFSEVYRLHRSDGTPYPVEELPVYRALTQQQTSMRDDIIVHRPDGRRIPLVSWAAPVSLPLSAGQGFQVLANLGFAQPGKDEQRHTPGGRRDGFSGADAAVWVLEDLTALHQAELARLATEQRLRTLLETMAEGLIVQDHKGAIVDCNTQACELFGSSAEQLRGNKLKELDCVLLRIDGSPLCGEEYPDEGVLRQGQPIRNLVLGIRHSTTHTVAEKETSELPIRWVLINAMPLEAFQTSAPAPREERGQPLHPSRSRKGKMSGGVITTFSNITHSIHAQKMLIRAEEQHQQQTVQLIESLPIMLLHADRNLKVEYANSAYQAITGFSLGEIADPADWAERVHPEDLPCVQEAASRALQGHSAQLELRYQAKDGSEKHALALLEPRKATSPNSNDEIDGITALLVDVTRERQLEQELQRSSRLELIGRLTSGIAHDFKNLLNALGGMTDLAQQHLQEPIDVQELQTDLSRVREVIDLANNLAQQLLVLGQPRPNTKQVVEVNRLVRRTLDFLQATLPGHIELVTDLAEEDFSIRADETHLQQVLMNLILNARDALSEGGTIRVKTQLLARVTPPEPNDFKEEGPTNRGAHGGTSWRERVEEPASTSGLPRTKERRFPSRHHEGSPRLRGADGGVGGPGDPKN